MYLLNNNKIIFILKVNLFHYTKYIKNQQIAAGATKTFKNTALKSGHKG